MLKYVLKRLAMAIPILVAVLTLVFIIIRIVPGDPAMVVLGDQASAEALAALRTKMGLDVPLIEQYFTFLSGVFRGDLGTSLLSGRAVLDEVMTVLPYTVDLTIAGVLIGVIFGVPLGVLTAVYRNSVTDYIIRVFSLIGLSFPAFYSAILLIIVFSIQFRIFPVISDPDLSDYGQRLRHLVLPAANLGLIMVASITRSTRSSMLEVLRAAYVRTAKAKGVPRLVVITRHALKNALIPVVTVIGLYLGVLIGNSVLTEIVFNRPGLGKLILDALSERDYTMLQGVMVIYAFIIVIVNLITDLTYGFVDPRVKHQ
ncbi:MAG: ABC transporter permease subunit [Desulfuromusa sp.]|nr:ABC transporter permease subunit [Desulfuromusa sp.]